MVCSSGPEALGGMREAKWAKGMEVSEMKPVETVWGGRSQRLCIRFVLDFPFLGLVFLLVP